MNKSVDTYLPKDLTTNVQNLGSKVSVHDTLEYLARE